MNDYEEATSFLGHWGRFQKVLFLLLFASTIPNGSGIISIVFFAAVPNHWCRIPEVNLTVDWLNAIIPIKVVNGEQELSSCSRYRLDVVRNLSSHGLTPGRDINLTDLEQEGCLDGWAYSKDTYQSTIVTEFDLVCNDQWKQPFTSTVYFIGVLFGSFFSGQIADRYGRKPVFFITMAVQTIFTFAQIFSPSWIVFSVLLFLGGLGQMANYMSAFLLGIETLTGKVRVIFSSLGVCLGFTIGCLTVPLLAFFLRDWKYFLLAIALLGLIYIPLWWFIPESPRWLVSQGRLEDAEAIVRKAAKTNKIEAPQVIFQNYTAEMMKAESIKDTQQNVLDLIRIRKLRPITLIFCMLWFTLTSGYNGLTLNSGSLSANPYISAFISVAVEIPGYISAWVLLQYLPRRPTVICMSLVGGLSLFFIQLVPQTLPELAIALEMLGKYGFTVSVTLTWTYTSEIFPTSIRGTATGTCSTVSRVGACIVPFLFHQRQHFKFLPYIIMGTLAVLCALASVFLPETFRQKLPETIQEMQQIRSMKCPCITQERGKTQKSVSVLESRL